ncbi:MAG: hypothetical protein IJH65_12565 [Methanobrevibacter sp.]|nr:hypothetical protein [Methanobrevibacter sp.]
MKINSDFIQDINKTVTINTANKTIEDCIPIYNTSTDANGWFKVEQKNYTMWCKRGTHSVQMTGNSWGAYRASVLPVGLSVDSKTFGAGFASCGDGAMKCSIGMTSGEIRLDRYWGYGSTVTLAVEWGFIIFKFN